MTRYLLPLLLSLCAVACTPKNRAVNYVVSTQSQYLCCRTIRYSTWAFPETQSSRLEGEGVVVRLLADSLTARCETDTEIGVAIANNSDGDIYVPISKEMEGERIKLYPWRILYVDGSFTRLARQLQYNDVLEREDALLRFFRIPSGRQITLRGVIPQRWLCSPVTRVDEDYLTRELNPTFYSDRIRGIRGAEYRRDPELRRSIGLSYEIAYTTLRYLDALPVTKEEWNDAGDTVQVTVAVKEEPATFLNASQRVARSNIVGLRIVD